ncbi:MAG: hypothetical protein KF784_14450 [Fimbriimonadaceae bacterium]|nr:hypothetical protein [Fimbriimonadaceae bacterium]
MERWIGPYRSVGEHWLPSAEVLELRRRARKYVMLGRVVLCAAFLLMFAWALVSLYALVFHQSLWYEQRTLVLFWIVGGILALVATAWGGYRLVKIGQGNRCEALVGMFERFVLTVDIESVRQTFGIDESSIREGIPQDAQSDLYIDVYPISQRIRTINGAIVNGYQKANIRTVAPARRRDGEGFPAHLAAEAGPMFLPKFTRYLNVYERSELRAIVFRFLRAKVAPWAIAGLMCGALTGLGLAWMPAVVDTLAYVALIITWTCFTTVVYRSYQLVRDLRSSVVVEVAANEKTGAGRNDDPLEVLPHTQWVWTRDGQPAPWRKS